MGHHYLIIAAFKKANKELLKEGLKEPSKMKKATLLSDVVEKTEGFVMSERNYRNYYTEATGTQAEDFYIKQPAVIKGLLSFLGYSTYEDFMKTCTSTEEPLLSSSQEAQEKTTGDPYIKTSKKAFVVGGLLLVVLMSLWAFEFAEEPRWMVWQEDHYEVAVFDRALFKAGKLKLYRADRIENFKQLRVDCDTEFFDKQAQPQVWYAKNEVGNLDCFSSPGLHPLTGKTLKKITPYMIEKYICRE